ncbi:MAG: four helix bundle protein [Oscillospiraceae bacterium]|nr:four helix bundle protein [Oscillospiraceae bacterium]
MAAKDYSELLVWQKAMDLAEEVYRVTKKLPKEETFALSDQMRRSAVSVPSNIAEGQGRGSSKEFLHFLSVAKGSKAELETQLRLCVRVGYLSDEEVSAAMGLSGEVGKMFNALKKTLSPSPVP